MNMKIGTLITIVVMTVILLGSGFGVGFLIGQKMPLDTNVGIDHQEALVKADQQKEITSDVENKNEGFWMKFVFEAVLGNVQSLPDDSITLVAESLGLTAEELNERLSNGDSLWELAKQQNLSHLEMLTLLVQLLQQQLDSNTQQIEATATPTSVTPLFPVNPPVLLEGRRDTPPDQMLESARGDRPPMDGMQPPPFATPPATPTPTS